MGINGKTRIYGVIADPIGHVRAPAVFNPLFRRTRIDAVCIPIHVTADNLKHFLQIALSWQNLHGIFVTIPHKEAAALCCQQLDAAATVVGAVNIIRRKVEHQPYWEGALYDGFGFCNALLAQPYRVQGKRAVILGAGGAAAAIAHALLLQGIAGISIVNRSKARRQRLVTRLQHVVPAQAAASVLAATTNSIDWPNQDLVINTTPLGLAANDPLPLAPQYLHPRLLVADIIMQPARTKLLKLATAKGCATFAGRAMFDHQVMLLAEFLGVAPGQL